MTTQQTLQTEEYKQTELGELPKDWEVMKFEDCLSDKRVKVSKLQQSQFKKIGKFPIVDQSQDLIAGYWDNNEDLFSSPLPIVIFGDHTRTFKFIDFPFVCGPDGTKILIPEISKVFPKFFYYYLRLLKIPSRGYNRHYSLLKDYLIPLPPLQEQQKIAYVLSTIQNAQEKTDNFINSLKELKKSSMKHLFTYGAVNFEDIDKVELKETEIGLMPKNWELNKLGEIFDIQQGKQLSAKEDKTGKIKIPFLRTSNLLWGKVDVSKIDYMFFSEKEVMKLQLNKNDVLVCEGGDVGRTALWKGELNGCLYQNHIYRLRPKEDYDSFLFVLWMEYAITTKKIYVANANRTTIPNLSASRLKDFFIPTPESTEQQRIASILSAIDSKIEAEESKKKALKEMFNSMLRDLMTAKIRVNNLEVGA